MGRKVLVLAEVKDGNLRNVSYEAIAAAKTVSEGGEVVGVLLGESVRNLAEGLIHYGADRVVVVENDKLSNYSSDGFSQAFIAVVNEEDPEAIIFGHTSLGKDLSPKVASKLDAGLISDVIDVEVAGDNVVFTRPIYSGKHLKRKS